MKKIDIGPFKGLKRAHYRVIVADPPWRFKSYSAKGQGKSASRYYKTMSLQEIAALPVADLAHPDGAVLLLWCPGNQLESAMQVMRWIGFPFVAVAFWVKMTETGQHVNVGTGYHWRDSVEPILIGRRGKLVPFQPKKPGISNAIVARIREHSRKPERFFADVEKLYRGPYISLFERTERKRWTAWGDQVGMFK